MDSITLSEAAFANAITGRIWVIQREMLEYLLCSPLCMLSNLTRNEIFLRSRSRNRHSLPEKVGPVIVALGKRECYISLHIPIPQKKRDVNHCSMRPGISDLQQLFTSGKG